MKSFYFEKTIHPANARTHGRLSGEFQSPRFRARVSEPAFQSPRFRARVSEPAFQSPIVSQVLEAHHGSIRVESELGQGATFIVALPLVERNGVIQHV